MELKSVLITGASTGIGRTTALHLDTLGWHVFAAVRRPRDADELRRDASERLTPVILDVTDRDAIRAAAWQVEQAAPNGLDGLVNNAGIVVSGPLEILPIDQLREQLEVNTVGQLAVTQGFLPLIHRVKGRIVNVSSINGAVAIPFVGPYAASKFALEALSDALRMELRRFGVLVIVIQPGAVDTPIWATAKARAEKTLSRAGGGGRYSKIIQRLLANSGRPPDHAIHPKRVARVIHKALTARKPKTRYLVGWDARIGVLLKSVVSDRLMDGLILRR